MLSVAYPVVLQNAQPRFRGLLDHPVKRFKRHTLFRIPAANVTVDAGKPDLIDALISFPQDGFESGTRVIDTERVYCVLDLVAQFSIGKLEAMKNRVDQIADVEGPSHGIDGIPHANKGNADIMSHVEKP